MSTSARRTLPALLPVLLVLLLVLTGCTIGATPTNTVVPVPTAAVATPTAPSPSPSATVPTATATAVATSTPRAASSPVPSAPVATPGARPGAASTPAAADETAIKAVIQRANDEQQQAFAGQDPTIMRDTATAGYYDELVRTNEDLAASGVATITLVRLEWGAIVQSGPTQAQATTFETWRTTYTDGSTDQGRERNVYTLVQEGGVWKVQADDHPDTPGAPPTSINPGGNGSGGAGTMPFPGVPTGPGQSRNWSGYAATGGKFTAVTGTWAVPQVNAASGSGADATWVGIGGEQVRDLIQAGTDATAAGGQVRYTAWFELLPQSSQRVPLVVSPGDRITVSIAQQADGTWLIAFQNQTSKQSYQTNVTYASSLSSAEWVEEAPSVGRRIVPLDDFGTIQFQNASAVEDGRQVTISQAGGKKITLIDQRGQSLATPSAIGADGASFSVQRAPVVPTSPTPVPSGGLTVPVTWALQARSGRIVA